MSHHAILSANDRRAWMRRALILVAATFAYNTVEAVIAIASGIAARSIALVGFGMDSILECAAAIVLFWRLRAEAAGARGAEVEAAERKVHRFVGGTFIALAIYVTAQAGWTLWSRSAPEESQIGIALAIVSLVVMPLVAVGKLRAAKVLGSGALRAEAKETLACSYLSFTLLAGLVARAVAGWWWADPVAALLMVPWLVKEGREGLSGGCCCDDDACS